MPSEVKINLARLMMKRLTLTRWNGEGGLL
jgi:hypothetical protein